MKTYKAKRETLRMEYVIFEAEDKDDALEAAQSGEFDGRWEPFWNQDEDWLYSVEEVKERGVK